MDLLTKRCTTCTPGMPKLDPAGVARLAAHVPAWRVAGDKLARQFVVRDFVHAMQFVNRMADLAEAEGHHPDFAVHYREVDVTVWTHAAGGLTENDFILAAKIDALTGP